MREVRPFPGHGCRYFDQGRCLYEEALNPGWDRTLACRVLAALEEGYDHFLAQAEGFGLGDGQAGALLQRRMERILARGDLCPDFAPAGEAQGEGGPDFPDCALRPGPAPGSSHTRKTRRRP
jgi:hypothetical protein